VLRIFLLEFSCRSSRFVQTQVVSGVRRLPNQSIRDWVLVQSSVGNDQESQKITQHGFHSTRVAEQKKSPGGAPRGKVGWWRKSTYTTIDTSSTKKVTSF